MCFAPYLLSNNNYFTQLTLDSLMNNLHVMRSHCYIYNRFLATFAFPTLFPDGKGDPTNPCLQRDISFGNIIQHLLKYAEKVHGKWVI